MWRESGLFVKYLYRGTPLGVQLGVHLQCAQPRTRDARQPGERLAPWARLPPDRQSRGARVCVRDVCACLWRETGVGPQRAATNTFVVTQYATKQVGEQYKILSLIS